VALEGNRVQVDATLRTSQPHIFAAGDVTGLYEVVHTAITQGEIAATNAVTGGKKEADYRLKTTVVFTEPEIASVGQTEAEARAAGIDCLTASYPFNDHGKSMIMGAKRGFVKLVAKPVSGEIIGGQIVGPHASDLIHELIAVMHYRGTAAELASIPHYHPTLAEIITYPAEEIADAVKARS
jgi:pyruvate/2-oxoglutarate dehydrogenase complex dihydrolipoamide dehydrogenase (E3) component